MATAKVLTSWDLSVDGVGFLGKAESIQLPEVEEITEEIRGCGKSGPLKIPMGMKLGDCTLKSLEITPLFYQLFGLAGEAVGLICKAGMRAEMGQEVPLVAILHGRFNKVSTDAFEAGKVPRQEAILTPVRYSLTIGGQPALVIDLENDVWNLAGGNDLTSGIKNLLGISI